MFPTVAVQETTRKSFRNLSLVVDDVQVETQDDASTLCQVLLELRRWHGASLTMVVLPAGARVTVKLRGQRFSTEGSARELALALHSWLDTLGPGRRPTRRERAALRPKVAIEPAWRRGA